MKMKSFIPNIEDSADFDDSDDEIPPGGVIYPMGVQGADSDDESDAGEDNNVDIEVPPEGLLQPIHERGSQMVGSDDESDADEDGSDNGDMSDEDGDSDDSSVVPPEGLVFAADERGENNTDEDNESNSDESVPDTTIEEVFGIKPSIEAHRDHPPDIKCDSGAVDICFHPQLELLSAATLDGEIIIYRYNRESAEEVTRFSHHNKACRTVCYSSDAKSLYTVSKDQSFSVIDTQNSSVRHHFKEAHEASIYSFYEVSSNICATGDDDGMLKLWDLRKKKSIFEFKCGEETVHTIIADKQYVAATLSDGSITGIDIRAKRVEAQSEMYSSELTAMSLIRDNSRLVVGSGEGVMYIFNWGEFGFHIDRYAGHPGQINSIIPLDDRLLLTGCEDGSIRAVHLYPHRFVGVVGQHKRFGIENMSVSFDGTFLASCAMDDIIRFWNIEFLYDVEVDGTVKGHKKHDKGLNLESSKKRNRSDFFSDIPEQMESDDEGGPVAGPSHTQD